MRMASVLLLFLFFLPPGSALAGGPEDRVPPWQTAVARPGEDAVLRAAAGTLPDFTDGTFADIPGAGTVPVQVLEAWGELHVRIPAGDAPLQFEEYSVIFPDGSSRRVRMPTEVRWLPEDDPEGPRLLASGLLATRPGALAVLLGNTGSTVQAITGLRYAPEAVSTGRVALLRSPPAAAAEGLDLDIPYFDGRTAFDPEHWEGLPFESFSFADGPLELAPGEQVLLAVGGEGFTADALFDVPALYGLNVWLTWTEGGTGHSRLLFRETRRPGP